MEKKPKAPKFNFQELKDAATSPDLKVRKKGFEEYFDRFEEFPSFLFDNAESIDPMFLETIEAIKNDPETSQRMQKGIVALMERLPSQ